MFYPSYEFKVRRAEYYERLTAVRERGEYERWVSFFCECMISSAEDAKRSLISLVELHEESARTIRKLMGRTASNGLALLEYLEGHPIVTLAMVRDALGISRTTAGGLVDELVDMRILKNADASRQRYRIYAYESYLAILRAGGEPL